MYPSDIVTSTFWGVGFFAVSSGVEWERHVSLEQGLVVEGCGRPPPKDE